MRRPVLHVQRVNSNCDSLEALARLRMEVFREWPYLYDGDRAYEERYLREFLSDANAVVVMASHDGRPVGMATASPLATQPASLTTPLLNGGIEIAKGFYFGESVLLPGYRGLGVGHRFFDERERAARAHGATEAVFCAVLRQSDHPLMPADARDLQVFWRGRGYSPLVGVQTHMAWTEVNASAESQHAMQFWHRKL